MPAPRIFLLPPATLKHRQLDGDFMNKKSKFKVSFSLHELRTDIVLHDNQRGNPLLTPRLTVHYCGRRMRFDGVGSDGFEVNWPFVR